MPIWVTLKNVLEEYLSSSHEMVKSPGIVLECHRVNLYNANQKICIVVKKSKPFDLILEAVNPS